MDPSIETRLFIISDTHGMNFESADGPSQSCDVAIHCGDLTDGSTLDEFHTTIQLLRSINAPLKLVIAGNHDFTMDIPAFERKVAEAVPALDPEDVKKEYGAPGDVRELFESLREEGIIFLDEGTHRFKLDNGASLTVYASPLTPALGEWGFQYHPNKGHKFSIDKDVDVVVTHGPPRGIMDFTYGRERAGCPDLFAAVAQAKPKVHCFGHIHEGWGAKLVSWREECGGDTPTHFTAIDNDKSFVVEKLSNLRPSKFDTEQDSANKSQILQRYLREKVCTASHNNFNQQSMEFNEETLFVNASFSGSSDDIPQQMPWIVSVDLPRAH